MIFLPILAINCPKKHRVLTANISYIPSNIIFVEVHLGDGYDFATNMPISPMFPQGLYPLYKKI